jgi:hypothetical protein
MTPRRVHVTIPDEILDLLREHGDRMGSTPTAFARVLIEAALGGRPWPPGFPLASDNAGAIPGV